MNPHPLRRAAAVVALSVLALGGSAVSVQAAADEPTPTVSAEPTVTPEPTDEPEPTESASPEPSESASPEPNPSVSPEPTTSPAPQPTASPEPTPSPEPTTRVVPVPAVTVTQPTCDGLNVVRNGSITVSADEYVDWIVLDHGSLYALDPEDIVLEVEEPGAPGTVEVAPGEYFVFAYPFESEFGDLGEWEQFPDDVIIGRSVTVTAFAGTCPLPTQLTDATKGGFTAPATISAGGTLVLSGLPAGASLRGYLFSVPTDLGVATVAADGTLRLTVPASVAVGTHRVALYRADGTLLGWQYVEVLAAGQQLAVTGADPRAGVAAGLVLVAAGGALVVARRRMASASA